MTVLLKDLHFRWLMRGKVANLIAGVALLVLVLLIAIPAISLPYQGDDVENHLIGTLSLHNTFQQAVAVNDFWMHTQGRFFPTSTVYHSAVWHVFDTKTSYHAFISVLLVALASGILFSLSVVLRRPLVTLSAFLVAVSGLQFRFWWVDGVSNMGGQITFTALLAFLAVLTCGLYARDRKVGYGFLAAGLWLTAITTYEVVLLLLPALLLLITCQRKQLSIRAWGTGSLPLVIPTILQLGVVLYLRSQVAPAEVRSEFTTNLDGPVFDTSLQQFLSGLPSSQYFLGGVPSISGVPLEIGFPWTTAVTLAALIGLPLVIAVGSQRNWSRACSGERFRAAKLAAAGLWIWLVPSVLVGVNGRWQQDLPHGQGYIYGFYETIGIALIVGAGLLLASAIRDSGVRRTILIGALAVSVFLAACTAASNIFYMGFFT